MKYLLLIFALLLFKVETNAQSLHNIRIVHGGEETKPIGTLSIAVESIIEPKDRKLDTVFGRTVKTDINSFNLLTGYLKPNKCLNPGVKKLAGSSEFYEIIVVVDSKEEDLFLAENDFYNFFNSLKSLLRAECKDKNLIEAFNYY